MDITVTHTTQAKQLDRVTCWKRVSDSVADDIMCQVARLSLNLNRRARWFRVTHRHVLPSVNNIGFGI